MLSEHFRQIVLKGGKCGTNTWCAETVRDGARNLNMKMREIKYLTRRKIKNFGKK